MKKKIFIWLFALLYIATGFVSTLHAIAFFSLANPEWIAVILAVVFEIGQAAVLFSILTINPEERHWIQWGLMIILTVVQVMGNVYSSFSWISEQPGDGPMKFIIAVFFQSPDDPLFDATAQYIIIAYITGAILPVVALMLTSIVAKMTVKKEEKTINSIEEPVILDKEKEVKPGLMPNKVII